MNVLVVPHPCQSKYFSIFLLPFGYLDIVFSFQILGNFPDIFLLLAANFTVVYEHTLCDVNPLKFIETCLMVQSMIYLGKCSWSLGKKYILFLLDGMFCKCQLGQGGW